MTLAQEVAKAAEGAEKAEEAAADLKAILTKVSRAKCGASRKSLRRVKQQNRENSL